MEVVAKSKYVRQSPRKLRLVADLVRELSVTQAISVLESLDKRAALPILLTLKQAAGNALGNFQLKKESLKIKRLEIGEGPRFKRTDKSHRAFRWGTIRKGSAHIYLVVEGEKMDNQKKVTKEKKLSARKKSLRKLTK